MLVMMAAEKTWCLGSAQLISTHEIQAGRPRMRRNISRALQPPFHKQLHVSPVFRQVGGVGEVG
jgi:hypothetical protein